MPFFSSLPEDATTRHIFQRSPQRFHAFAEFSQSLMRGDSPLSPGVRELLGAYVSALNECAYCVGGHIATAKRFGIEPDLLQALLDDIDNAHIEDRLKPLFRYVKKLSSTPHKMVQADADAVFALGWPEQALEDAIGVCCSFSFMNRLVQGYGIVADDTKFDERARQHAELGYVGQLISPAKSAGKSV
ncbi:MAG: peroxidase-related enzyme [Pseudomonadales bacterium]|nr:peroxidase-related enzyme [Pseudomonadales bacterium]